MRREVVYREKFLNGTLEIEKDLDTNSFSLIYKDDYGTTFFIKSSRTGKADYNGKATAEDELFELLLRIEKFKSNLDGDLQRKA